MAQQVEIAGVLFNNVPYIQCPDGNGVYHKFLDTTIPSNAASASDIAQGKLAYVNDLLVTGTNQGGSGGLVYETGTWTPASDTGNYVITFANTHTTPPAFYEIVDATGTYSSMSNSFYRIGYVQWDRLLGSSVYIDFDNSESVRYGRYDTIMRTTSATSMSTQGGYIHYPATETGDSTINHPRYWATETGIKAAGSSSNRYWRTGRTYKWIAVWAPTS